MLIMIFAISVAMNFFLCIILYWMSSAWNNDIEKYEKQYRDMVSEWRERYTQLLNKYYNGHQEDDLK